MKIPFKEGDVCVFKVRRDENSECIGIVSDIDEANYARIEGFYNLKTKKYDTHILVRHSSFFTRLATEEEKSILAIYDDRVFAKSIRAENITKQKRDEYESRGYYTPSPCRDAHLFTGRMGKEKEVKLPPDYDPNKNIYIKDGQGNIKPVLPGNQIFYNTPKTGYCHDSERCVMGVDPADQKSDKTAYARRHIASESSTPHLVYVNREALLLPHGTTVEDFTKEMIETSKYYSCAPAVESNGITLSERLNLYERTQILHKKSKLNVIKYRRK